MRESANTKTSQAPVSRDNPQEPKKTRKPKNSKYNRKKIIALASQNVPQHLIAKDQNVSESTISKFLARVKPELKQIQQYSNIKADVLAQSQLKKQTIENIITDNWLNNPEIITSQDVRLQKEVLVALQGGKTYDHNAERLERGKSTSNIAQLHADIAKIRQLDIEDEYQDDCVNNS
jgi:hypothetical protein